MTDTLMGVSPPPEPAGARDDAEDRTLSPADLAAVEDLVHRARQAGIALTGPDWLLNAMTKTVIEAAIEEEIADHLGYDKHAVEGRNRGQLTQRETVEDGADRQLRRGRHRRPPRPRRHVRAAAGEKRQRRLGEVDDSRA